MKYSDNLDSSLLIRGDTSHAFRDPAVLYHNGRFHLWSTYVETESDGQVYMYLCHMFSDNLRDWSEPEKITVRDKRLNYSSPGNVVRFDGKWVMCFQTYCRENGEKYGNNNSRLYAAESEDLEHWTEPRLLRVKGDEVSFDDMGRMIDPYLVEKDGVWYCYFKQNGISISTSYDLVHWKYEGHINGGENTSIVEISDGIYRLCCSPSNGLAWKESTDLIHWHDSGELLTLGQSEWEWARGRLTAGVVVKTEEEWLLFFHGTGPQDESVDFDINASIGVAWSDDGVHWNWRSSD